MRGYNSNDLSGKSFGVFTKRLLKSGGYIKGLTVKLYFFLQHILVGSALRRPHATEYSPLDYQSMPDVGKIPRQPYRSQSSCTVYTYADCPVPAREQSSHLGRHTKSR